MNDQKVFIGTTLESFKYGKCRLYLSKHSWGCGWYWGFGYIGNPSLHCHFVGSFIEGAPSEIEKIFLKPKFTQGQWWILRDLFIQAEALKKAAEVYRYGGRQTNKAMRIESPQMSARINRDLEKILNEIWRIVSEK